MAILELKEIIEEAWIVRSSADQGRWSPRNPSWGQDAVTALIVQDHSGGEIVNSDVIFPKDFYLKGVSTSHYFNKINEKEVDLTKQQFPEGTVIPEGKPKPKEYKTTREYLLSNERTSERYELLKREIEGVIKRRLAE